MQRPLCERGGGGGGSPEQTTPDGGADDTRWRHCGRRCGPMLTRLRRRSPTSRASRWPISAPPSCLRTERHLAAVVVFPGAWWRRRVPKSGAKRALPATTPLLSLHYASCHLLLSWAASALPLLPCLRLVYPPFVCVVLRMRGCVRAAVLLVSCYRSQKRN